MKLENVTLDNVIATRKIITDKLAMAIRQPSGIDEGRYANLLADVKALDAIAAPLAETARAQFKMRPKCVTETSIEPTTGEPKSWCRTHGRKHAECVDEERATMRKLGEYA